MGFAFLGINFIGNYWKGDALMDHWINIIPLIIIAAACYLMLIVNKWQKALLSCGMIYLSAFLIMLQFWSFNFSLVKLISGLMALVIIGLSLIKRFHNPTEQNKARLIFRLSAYSLILLIMVFMSSGVTQNLSIPLEIVLASFIMIGFAIFQLGISQEPYKVFLAIMTFLLGFELIFTTNESSLLINGLLSMITLLISVVGGYIIVNEFESSEE